MQTPITAALNHLLRAEAWARDKLAPFAGAMVELRAPPLPSLRFSIRQDGTLGPAGADASPALSLTLDPGMAAAFWRGNEHLLKSVKVEGDERLAEAVLALVRHLRWDAEEDLSRVVGDVAAHRIVQTAKDALAWQRDAAQRLAEASADYFADEKRVLVRSWELQDLGSATAELRDAIERLQKRVERLG
jgi:ubiquinone biosynthesis protein UbiJ